MVCLNVYIVYDDSQEFFNISLYSYFQPFHLDVIYNMPELFLIWSCHNIIVSVQYMYDLSLVEHTLVNLDLPKPNC